MNLAIVKQIALLRKRPLLALAAVMIVAAALQVFVSLYQQPMLEKTRSAWLQQRAAEGRGAAMLSRDLVFKNGQADFIKFKESIYPKNQFARFVAEIYEAVGRNNLEVSSISYKPDLNKESNLLQYSLGLSLVGNYTQLKKFIGDLDNTGNLLHIDSLSLTVQASKSDLVQLQVQLTAYFRMEAQ